MKDYVASPRYLSAARKSHLVALEVAGDKGLAGCHEHPTALLAAMVSLGWAARATPNAHDRKAGASRFLITQGGRDVLAQATKGRAG